jgi:vesicle transport through interaction with t-SNAREs protein 1
LALKNVQNEERRSILQIQNKILKTSDSIARSTQVAIETENIGNEVLGELNQQGQQLKRATQRVR